MGRKKEKEYNHAYELFTQTNLSKTEIARIAGGKDAGISLTQLNKWIRENDWELDKTANDVSVPKLIRNYYQNLNLINQKAAEEKRPLDSSECDQVIKITNAINALRKRYNLSNYHAILKECLEWLNLEHNDGAKILAPLMFEFLQHKANEIRNDS